MNRFKFIFVLIVLALIVILWVQNQELVALQFFCPDTTVESTCLYRTPQLTIATWMIIFALAGAVSNILSQVLARTGARPKIGPPKRKEDPSQKFYREKPSAQIPQANTLPNPESQVKSQATQKPLSDWAQESDRDWETTPTPNVARVQTKQTRKKAPTSRRSGTGSVYSSEKQDLSSGESNRTQDKLDRKNLSDRNNSNREEIYDATYRTVGSSQTPEPRESKSDDDEQWI